MINNEFHLIGIATSNYTDIGNGRYTSYLLRVEIEKFGAKAGKSFEIEVQIYGTNKKVDTSVEVLGCQVAINGYLDSFETKEGSLINKLVAQNVYVLDNARERLTEAVVNKKTNDVSPVAEKVDVEPLDDIENYDDDLPF